MNKEMMYKCISSRELIDFDYELREYIEDHNYTLASTLYDGARYVGFLVKKVKED